jgi:glyoxylase-like metal-dependent hydrolase (beta-lactamase superfamily II)
VTLDRPEGWPDEFGVYAIRYASREGRRGEHFHGHDDRSGEPHPTAYFIWPAVSAEHTVVVDTGIGPDRAARIPGLRYLASPPDILEALGVPAASVGHVVLTHLHYDHTGTARAFATARYVLQRAEVGYWTGPCTAHRAGTAPGRHGGPRAPDGGARGGPDAGLDGDATVVPGLSVHLVGGHTAGTGGHTAGMQVVRVRTARGHVVLASGASHFYENIEDDRPFAILHHLPGMYGAFDRIKELADGPGLVVAGHDPEVLDRYPACSAAGSR